ncbi:MAG: Lrp/AsnC family transcriptional regulator [Spirochaetales bacterium]|nr:Lrp/AsnC family transcriptional regulator [Spirochaetales bacterium]
MNDSETTIELLHALKDGRRKFREIANELGMAENTARSRYRKLKDAGVLEVTALVDPERLPGHQTALIGIKANTPDLVGAGERIRQLRGVVGVRVVTGRYDLIVEVLLKEDFGLLAFFTEELTKVKDVRDYETFVVYKSFGNKVPYVL